MPKSTSFIIKAWNLFKEDEENIRSSFNALKTITTEHERIHQGKMYSYSDISSLAADASTQILFSVASDSSLHLRKIQMGADVGACEGYLYENPYVDVASLGTGFKPQNLNRESSNISASSFYIDAYLDVNSLGVEIDASAILQATGGNLKSIEGGADSAVVEWILKRGNNYMFKFTNNNAGIALISKHFSFYEPSDS